MSGDALQIVSRSDIGCVRSINEDCVAVDVDGHWAVVADGMGGHSAGDVAAQAAVRYMGEYLTEAGEAQAGSPEATAALMREAMQKCSARMCQKAAKLGRQGNMGATMVSALFLDNRATIGHIGDARAYLFRAGSLHRLTNDHSLVQEARELGVMNDDAAAASHNRHLVSRALGMEESPEVEVHELGLEPGDILLMCSDGLNDMVDGQHLQLVLRTLEDHLPLAADQMVMMAKDNGGHDNVSLVLVRVNAPFPLQAKKSGGALSFLSRLGLGKKTN